MAIQLEIQLVEQRASQQTLLALCNNNTFHKKLLIILHDRLISSNIHLCDNINFMPTEVSHAETLFFTFLKRVSIKPSLRFERMCLTSRSTGLLPPSLLQRRLCLTRSRQRFCLNVLGSPYRYAVTWFVYIKLIVPSAAEVQCRKGLATAHRFYCPDKSSD